MKKLSTTILTMVLAGTMVIPFSSVKAANVPQEKCYTTSISSVQLATKQYDFSNYPALQEGATGYYVTQLQEALNAVNSKYHGAINCHTNVDGSYGPDTYRAVYNFQTWAGIKQDGKAGPQTWGNLEAYLNNDPY